ncbi:MAG: hypothetical protein ACP6IP_03560 [Candidatus Njordarchaeia archaeon]
MKVLRKIVSVAEEFAGAFKAKKQIPDDLDEFLSKMIHDWWKEKCRCLHFSISPFRF